MSKRTAIHLCFALCGSKDPLKSRSAFSKSVIAKQALLKHKWLRLDPEGTTAVLQTGKHALTQRLGVQVRMLHLAQHLDPYHRSSPGCPYQSIDTACLPVCSLRLWNLNLSPLDSSFAITYSQLDAEWIALARIPLCT